MSHAVQLRVCEIVADVTMNPTERVTIEAAANQLEGWDSLAQVNIIVAIEAEYGVTFDADQVHSLNSVAKIAEALRASTSAGKSGPG